MSKQFTDENFQTEVIDASKDKPVLVDFFAEWCGPCKIQGPIIDELAGEVGDTAITGKLNTEKAMNTAQQFGIMSIPTILVFRNGKVVEQFVGVQNKDQLKEILEKHK